MLGLVGSAAVALNAPAVASGAVFDRAFGFNVEPGGGSGFENCTTETGCQAGADSTQAGGFPSRTASPSTTRGGSWS